MWSNVSESSPVELDREELREQLDGALSRRLTILQAPSGYGKTTTIRQAVRRWQAAGVIVEEITHRGNLVLWQGGHERTKPAIPAARERTIVVVDDLPEGDDPSWAGSVVAWLCRAPAHHHLVLSLRRPPPEAVLQASRAAGAATAGHEILGAAALRFSRAECQTMLAARHDATRSATLSVEVHYITAGWPVAVAAVLDDTEAILVRHLLSRAESERARQVLEIAALLGGINGDLGDHVSGRPDTALVLKDLAGRGLLSAVSGTLDWFEPAFMIAEVLKRELATCQALWSRAVQRAAATWLLERNERRRALTIYLALGDHAAAAALLIDQVPLSSAPVGPDPSASPARSPVPRAGVDMSGLSVREHEVLGLLATGMRNIEIARGLHVSLSTVKAHIYNVRRKLGAGNRTAAVARARARGLLS